LATQGKKKNKTNAEKKNTQTDQRITGYIEPAYTIALKTNRASTNLVRTQPVST